MRGARLGSKQIAQRPLAPAAQRHRQHSLDGTVPAGHFRESLLHHPVEADIRARRCRVTQGRQGMDDIAEGGQLDHQHLHAAAPLPVSKASSRAATCAGVLSRRQRWCSSGHSRFRQGAQPMSGVTMAAVSQSGGVNAAGVGP